MFVPPIRAFVTALMLSAPVTGAALAADKIEVLTPKIVPAAEAPADAERITISKMKYDKPEVTIKAGQTVTWINTEAMPHNIAFKAGVLGTAKFDGAMMKKDTSYSLRFNEPGSYDYHCTPHPFMKGKVIVE